jgi:hypothetical protein
MVTREDYSKREVEAARSVLLELIHLLGEYTENIVLVGGWVPEFLFEKPIKPHIGSIDVDLALDHRYIKMDGYKTIQKLLKDRGYKQGNQPYKFHRIVRIDGGEIIVEIDFLSGEYGGTGSRRRHQRINDLRVRKARGCDLAFSFSVIKKISGYLPEGGKDTRNIKVASIVPFLVMKGMALDDRLKEKDAWDIYFCMLNFPGGITSLSKEIKPYLTNNLVLEGLKKIAKNFASIKHFGPKFVADFEELIDSEERDILIRDAYERVSTLMKNLKIS